MEKLAKHMVAENGISYTLGEDGLYYPDLVIPKDTNYPIRKYGHMRERFLKEHRHWKYIDLIMRGELNTHLHQVDEECFERVERMVEQLKVQHGVTEELKMKDPMQWVGMMNNLHHMAEEVVLRDVVYGK
ncbi:MAG: TnpV protein [Eubacteriales bacterium]